MLSPSDIQRICSALIEQQKLPDDFHHIVNDTYLPLSRLILQRKKSRPLLVSINGAQGTGKSTMTMFLKYILEAELAASVAVLSLDDFYSVREKRLMLAKEVHPLLVTRGVPGTHDIDLLEQVLDQLLEQRSCRSPVFDKAMDERCHESMWTVYEKPVGVILFEGWCNNSPAQQAHELLKPVNELEQEEDKDGTWRRYVNEQLQCYHQRVFDRSDMCIMLKAPDFDCVYRWRSLQEKKLKTRVSGEASDEKKQQHIMSDVEMKRFIQHFERITRHTLAELPKTADIVLPLDVDHSITGITKEKF
ncbi:MAG: hypothetical protein IMF14_04570 [Proteobacteria bacterium]|nr:hypothetical protein [Pseudomonadota bacterium]